MAITDAKYFGVLSAISVGVIFTVFSFVLRINVIYLKPLGKIPIYFGLIPIIMMLLFTLLNKGITRRTLNWIYLGVAIFTFIYLNSMFQWSVECCPEKYKSILAWNAAKGLIWIVDLPVVFVITLIQGLIYDILIALKMKKRKVE